MISKLVNKITRRSILSAFAATILLQGCASTVMHQVSESDRDLAGGYNGAWQGTVVRTAAKQYGPGNWELSCGNMAGRNVGQVSVEGGLAKLKIFGDVQQAYVNNDGRFRFEIPMAEVAAAGGNSDSSISQGKMTFILYGSLKKQAGTLTFGIAEFANNGCSSKVKFTRI